MTEQTKIDKACKHCGSDGVLVDAWGQWNADRQKWELAATFDHCYCPACDGETHAIDKPLAN